MMKLKFWACCCQEIYTKVVLNLLYSRIVLYVSVVLSLLTILHVAVNDGKLKVFTSFSEWHALFLGAAINIGRTRLLNYKYQVKTSKIELNCHCFPQSDRI